MRVEPRGWNHCPYKRNTRQSPSPFLHVSTQQEHYLCEQEVGLTSTTVGNKCSLCMPPSLVFCHSSLNRLRHFIFGCYLLLGC